MPEHTAQWCAADRQQSEAGNRRDGRGRGAACEPAAEHRLQREVARLKGSAARASGAGSNPEAHPQVRGEVGWGSPIRPTSQEKPLRFAGVTRRTGIEPATTGVTSRYSNQLSYRPNLERRSIAVGGTVASCQEATAAPPRRAATTPTNRWRWRCPRTAARVDPSPLPSPTSSVRRQIRPAPRATRAPIRHGSAE